MLIIWSLFTLPRRLSSDLFTVHSLFNLLLSLLISQWSEPVKVSFFFLLSRLLLQFVFLFPIIAQNSKGFIFIKTQFLVFDYSTFFFFNFFTFITCLLGDFMIQYFNSNISTFFINIKILVGDGLYWLMSETLIQVVDQTKILSK